MSDFTTMAERYSRALSSTHLEAVADERGSVDMLIAAGWVSEGLGTSLYRLRTEFDACRGGAVQAARNLSAMQQQVQKADAAAEAASAEDAPRLREIAGHLRKSMESTALTDRAMLLVTLKSLDGTSQAVGRFAAQRAAATSRKMPEAMIRQIAGQALDFWLDPLCMTCAGTGAVGGYGNPRVICKACGGSKTRPMRFGSDNAGHDFGRDLIEHMNGKVGYVSSQLKRFLAQA
jgi:hypothetical protein